MMSDQEQQRFSQDEEDSICRSMLHLSTAAHDYPTTSESPEKYAMTLCSSGKRPQSPLSPSSFQEPAPKRPNFNSEQHHLVSGLTKLPLPHSFPLRRTISEPIHSISAQPLNFQAQLPQNSPAPLLNQPPQESSGRNSGQESFPFPFSTATPPRPPRPRQSSSFGESPTNKRLKRMKERMREMSQWWNQLLREQEEDDDDDGQSDNHSCHPKEASESGMEDPAQEAVWVEKKGDCLVLHFKCPCGNGYQILLIGNTCYYKLTTF